MKVKTEKRCGCRGADGKQLGKHCPKLKQRGHGKWSYRVRVPDELVPLVGRQFLRGSGYATQKEAEEEGEEQLAKVRAGQQAIGGLTVGAYLDEQWFPSKQRLRPTTRARYADFIRLHIKPYLGEIPLAALRSDHISTAFRRIQESNATRARPVGPATIKDIHDMLKTALSAAVKQRMIPFNPAEGVELPEYSPPEIEPWGAEEVGAFLDEAAGDRLAALYELVALHGLRRGEACGATWAGLDEENAVLVITQQIVKNGTEYGVWPPKTRSGRRKVDLDATTLGSLLAHRLRQDAEREAVGPAWSNGTLPDQHGKPVKLSGLMFTRLDGRHLDPQYVTRRMQQIARRAGLCAAIREPANAGALTVVVGERYRDPVGTWTLYVDREPVGEVTVVSVEGMRGKRARLRLAEPLPVEIAVGAELGRGLLPGRRLHDLRHSSASIQLAEGLDLALVSKRLGHSTPAITGSLYVHLLRSSGQRAAETVAAAIPRRRAHDVPTTIIETTKTLAEGGVSPGQGLGPAPANGA